MKNLFGLVVLLSFNIPSTHAQQLTSEELRPGRWHQRTVLACADDNGEPAIRMMARSKKVKGTSIREKQLKIWGERYWLRKSSNGVYNLVNSDGEVALKTSKDRNLAYFQGQEYSRKKIKQRVLNYPAYEYYDERGQLVVKARVDRGIIRLKKYVDDEVAPLLMAACFEDLVTRVHTRFQAGLFVGTYPLCF